MATTGALSAGFGSFQRFSRLPHASIALAALGMGGAAFVGVLVGPSVAATAAAAGVVAAIGGMATQFGQAPWWFTLQWGIALFIATATPGGLGLAAMRGLLVLGGGLLQLGVISLYWLWRPFGAQTMEVENGPRRLSEVALLGRALAERMAPGGRLRYAVAAGAMASAAALAERILGLENGYWTPTTALIILKPRLRDTATRIAQRTLGTLIGGAAVTLIAALARPNGLVLVGMVIVMAWSAYAVQRVNYAVFTFCITATVAFPLAMTGLPTTVVVLRRVLCTILGAGLALTTSAALGAAARLSEERPDDRQ